MMGVSQSDAQSSLLLSNLLCSYYIGDYKNQKGRDRQIFLNNDSSQNKREY